MHVSLRDVLNDRRAWIWSLILGSSPCLFYVVTHLLGHHTHSAKPYDIPVAIVLVTILVPAGIVSAIARRYYFFWGGVPVVVAILWWHQLYPPSRRAWDDVLDPVAVIVMGLVYSLAASGPISLIRWIIAQLRLKAHSRKRTP